MEIFDFETEFVKIREYSKQYSIKDILLNNIPSNYINEIFRMLLILRDKASLVIGTIHQYHICQDIKIDSIDDTWKHIKEFTRQHFSTQHYLEYFLFEFLIYIYDPIPCLAHIERNAVDKLDGIMLDKDGLIDCNASDFVFKKEGVLFKDYYFFYNKALPGAFISHGFVSDILEYSRIYGKSVKEFKLSLCWDLILHRKYWKESITKAYIRGPRGLSEKMLKSKSFPEDKSGTVTEHRRIDPDPVQDLVCPLERVEIMWSWRDQFKSVQIEELRPVKIGELQTKTKYLHSQWEIGKLKVVHLDGAILSYSQENYNTRIGTDMKKYRGQSETYEKLFKLNAELELKEWCVLVTKYFYPNELIGEYLGGFAEEID